MPFVVFYPEKKLLTSITLNDILHKKVEKLSLLAEEIRKEDRRNEEIRNHRSGVNLNSIGENEIY
jgi:hypothetical protein